MNDKRTWIRLPRTVLAGHGVSDDLEAVLEELHPTATVVVVTSPTPRAVLGDAVIDRLRERGRSVADLTIEAATPEEVERVGEVVTEAGDAVLVGIGGGKVIDVTKVASHDHGRPFVSVPTAASHDGIVSNRASIPDGEHRHSVAARPPTAVVADTAIIAQAPWELTTAGSADIISNYTAVTDWRLAHRLKNVPYSEYAAALSEMTAELLVSRSESIKAGLEESAWMVTKALVSSGVAMSIAGSSRPASGAEHLFSHQLDRLAPDAALHGHQVGVGAIMIAHLQWGENGAWADIRDALATIGAPTTAADLGIDPEVVLEALATAHEIRDRYTILGDGISRAAAERVATETGVI
ncbi:MAG: NAD(P)-dependent glycerol-1-phosphate dehydrogenase [Halobacteriales archaeon]